jgi:hypothetical protein
MVDHLVRNEEATGSIPVSSTNPFKPLAIPGDAVLLFRGDKT